MWVKICGNTNVEDCLLAADLGADALGFVFAESKRHVTAGQVATITAQLPQHVETIGVFTTTNYAQILQTAEDAGLTGVQLHGDIDFTLLERLRVHFGDADIRCRVLQVLPWWTDLAAGDQQEVFAAQARALAEDGSADALLIDSRTRHRSGGTGVTLDWVSAKNALRGIDCRIIVAGGLTPENVGEAIAELQPWGVDAVSGVEASPGRKSPEKLKAFLKQARQ